MKGEYRDVVNKFGRCFAAINPVPVRFQVGEEHTRTAEYGREAVVGAS
jgi:hypothetical protein